jgi:hypothetical protein
MAALSLAMNDAAVIAWQYKERYGYWRPVTALRARGIGGGGAPDWLPLIETPGHPEYPSGHATDCAAGATILASVFGTDSISFSFRSLGPSGPISRRFSRFSAAQRECSLSRIWAGVHFLDTEDRSEELGASIARAAMQALGPMPH